MGLGMGMGMNEWEWEGMAFKKIFLLISTQKQPPHPRSMITAASSACNALRQRRIADDNDQRLHNANVTHRITCVFSYVCGRRMGSRRCTSLLRRTTSTLSNSCWRTAPIRHLPRRSTARHDLLES